jgi:nucleotide-binding universal stress UspA family protein
MVDPGTPVLVAAVNHADSEAALELAELLWPPDRVRVAGYVRGQSPVLVGGDGAHGELIASVVTEAVLGHGVAVIADLSGHEQVLSPPYEQIVRETNLPMLVLRSRPGPKPGWNRLLVPVSGATTSDAALDVALTVGAASDARVTVLHAIPPVVPDRSGITFGSRQRRVDYRWQQATALLDHAQRFGRDAGVETVVRMVSDQSPAQAVAAMSARHDLVVLGVRRRSQSAFLGYTADEIVRSGLCDVLLVILPED